MRTKTWHDSLHKQHFYCLHAGLLASRNQNVSDLYRCKVHNKCLLFVGEFKTFGPFKGHFRSITVLVDFCIRTELHSSILSQKEKHLYCSNTSVPCNIYLLIPYKTNHPLKGTTKYHYHYNSTSDQYRWKSMISKLFVFYTQGKMTQVRKSNRESCKQ